MCSDLGRGGQAGRGLPALLGICPSGSELQWQWVGLAKMKTSEAPHLHLTFSLEFRDSDVCHLKKRLPVELKTEP